MDDKKQIIDDIADEILTKEKILDGESYFEDVYFEHLKGKLRLYAVNDGEYNHVKLLRMQSVDIENENDVELEKLFEGSYQANCQLVAYSLSKNGITWTIDEVKQMPFPGIVEKIVTEINRISEVDDTTLDPFRVFEREIQKHFNGSDTITDDGNNDNT